MICSWTSRHISLAGWSNNRLYSVRYFFLHYYNLCCVGLLDIHIGSWIYLHVRHSFQTTRCVTIRESIVPGSVRWRAKSEEKWQPKSWARSRKWGGATGSKRRNTTKQSTCHNKFKPLYSHAACPLLGFTDAFTLGKLLYSQFLTGLKNLEPYREASLFLLAFGSRVLWSHHSPPYHLSENFLENWPPKKLEITVLDKENLRQCPAD